MRGARASSPAALSAPCFYTFTLTATLLRLHSRLHRPVYAETTCRRIYFLHAVNLLFREQPGKVTVTVRSSSEISSFDSCREKVECLSTLTHTFVLRDEKEQVDLNFHMLSHHCHLQSWKAQNAKRSPLDGGKNENKVHPPQSPPCVDFC